ncbi:MAG: RDD family protein [Pseudomonadales bacterium]|nr:RDD family protein [Candidatus Woesebacteria bacterium]MCB9801783.1 RDD family protein [Pseudomonadales bacterium]
MNSTPQYAPVETRITAWLLDTLFIFLVDAVALWLWMQSAPTPESFVVWGVVMVLLFMFPLLLLGYLYEPFFLSRFGATPGKMLVGLRVVKDDAKHTLLSFQDAFFRTAFCKTITAGSFGFGLFRASKYEKKQAWHDEMAGTVVLQSREGGILAGLIALCVMLLIAGYCYYTVGVYVAGLFT